MSSTKATHAAWPDSFVDTSVQEPDEQVQGCAQAPEGGRTMIPSELSEKLACAATAVDDIYRRQDAIYVEWTLLQADAALLARKLDAFAELIPGCLGTPQQEQVK